MNKKTILAVAFIAAALSLNAEVSAFDAGNLNTQSPYGLTDSEKEVLRNKHNVATLESSLSLVEEQLQGMQSLLEGISARMSKLEQRVNDLELRVNGDVNSSGNSIASLKAYVEETRAIQEKNYKNIQDTMNKLGSLIDKKVTSTSVANAQSQKGSSSSNIKDTLSKKNNKDVFDEGIKLFNANKNDEAKVYFEYLISKNSRPATSNFYLGEIAYKEKSYASAIKHFQKSIELDDKASYLPKLLYHTAISFDKVGDTASANRFYKALKAGYPDTKEAQASPDRN